MKALSQSEYGELRCLYESVYTPKFESILDEFTDEDLDDLTDEYIEEQVTEFFQECLEEGLDIEILEETICESIDASLDILIERVDPAETQRRRDQAKDRLSTSRSMKSAAEKSSAKPSLKVSTAKVGSSSPEKKASALSRIKGAVKKVGKAAQGGIGLAARAVGTAQRAGSAVKSAAKSGYERGRQGSGTSSTTSSSGSSDSGESTSSSAGSSDSESSAASAPKKRKDGLLKRGLKKLIRGASKAVSVGAGAVKAGADYVTDRARKEQMNYNDIATIQELYSSIYEPQDVEEVYIKEDSRRMSNKQKTANVRQNIKAFGSNFTPPNNYDPDANRGQGEVLTRKQMEKKRRKSLRQEELEATGLFTTKEIEAIMEAEINEGSYEDRIAANNKRYDANRKRAAQRAAARNAARDAGQTGAVKGVGYVTPRREKETYTDSAGKTRHAKGL